MINLREFLKNGEELKDLTPEQAYNTGYLLAIMNQFRRAYGRPMIVTSGYRSPEYNKKVGGSPRSAHCSCQAIDIKDDGLLKRFVLSNGGLITQLGLYFEDFDHTPGWVHFTIRPPKSGKRFFKP